MEFQQKHKESSFRQTLQIDISDLHVFGETQSNLKTGNETGREIQAHSLKTSSLDLKYYYQYHKHVYIDLIIIIIIIKSMHVYNFFYNIFQTCSVTYFCTDLYVWSW